jgi:23S rRNA (uracil1939-C5)-methyltransferase
VLIPGSEVCVEIEKPAAGGRMIARHEGQILLVAGAIPGERVNARIERVEKRLAFAFTTSVLEPSPDRRAAHDLLCGGSVYAHIAYPRQVRLKAEIIADAFIRIGRIPLADAVNVMTSPENGYRLRARLHVREHAAGFYREGTHTLCDARLTHQLSSVAMDAVDAALGALGDARSGVTSLELSENISADERAVHFNITREAAAIEPWLARAVDTAGLSGCTARGPLGPLVRVGRPTVFDPLSTLTNGRAVSGRLGRQPASFFQGNRFVLPELVVAVLDAVRSDGVVVDLYSGVGLFSIVLAATGHHRITAVEGDKASSSDLRENAADYSDAIDVVAGRVEDFIRRTRERANTIVVDPPRTGISREAMEAIAAHGADRVIYVSCDPPTMARDARRLLDGGYRLTSLAGFDLFPNTPHVESVGVFDRS